MAERVVEHMSCVDVRWAPPMMGGVEHWNVEVLGE